MNISFSPIANVVSVSFPVFTPPKHRLIAQDGEDWKRYMSKAHKPKNFSQEKSPREPH